MTTSGPRTLAAPRPANLRRLGGWARRHPAVVAAAAAVIAPLVTCAALVPARSFFAGTAVALVLVVVIVAASVAGSRVAGVVATLSSAVWFDLFFTRPYDRLTISHRPDLETTIALVVAGVVINELAARNRRHRRGLDEEISLVAALRETTELASSSTPESTLVEHARATLVSLLSLRDCRYETVTPGPPLARLRPDGEVLHVGLSWPVDEIGLPGPQSEIPLDWRGLSRGRFVLTPTPGRPVSRERRIIAVLVADLVAAALSDPHRVA